LLNKMPLLQTLVFIHCPDIVIVTETWATPCVSNSELNIQGYDYIRNDRHEGRGGGSCIYIKQPLTFLPLDYRQFTAVEESCWLRVVLKDNYSLLVGCVYRPPNASGDYDLRLSQAFHAAVDLNMKYCLIAGDFNLPEVHWFPPSGPAKFENLLEAIDTGMWDQEVASHLEVLIAGDFNAPMIDWVNLTVDGALTSFGRKLMDLTLDQSLVQKVNIPTRFRENKRENCLDLVLTKDVSSIDEVYSIAPLGKSDHSTLMWDYSLYSQRQNGTECKQNI
uniref:Endo/exonuclease/phosphatase domain-containing protein n=1 Tax=Schistocephalus solidus TaxID=70667 RepID=A0A183SUQ0_SCHSO